MNMLCWNVRGATSTKFRVNLMELNHRNNIGLLFLCEPRICGQTAISMVKSLGFPCYEIVDATRFSGGLWLLWKNDKVSIDVLGITDQTITVCVHGVWGWCKSMQFRHFMKTTAGGNHSRVEGTWWPRFGAQLKGTSQPRFGAQFGRSFVVEIGSAN